MVIGNEIIRVVPGRQDEDSVPVAGPPSLKDTVMELAMTSCGIVGVILLIFAGLRLLGYR